MKGVSGSLLALDVLGLLTLAPSQRSRLLALRAAVAKAARTIGPASAAPAIFDALLVPVWRRSVSRARATSWVGMFGSPPSGAFARRCVRGGRMGNDLGRLIRLASAVDRQDRGGPSH